MQNILENFKKKIQKSFNNVDLINLFLLNTINCKYVYTAITLLNVNTKLTNIV